MTRALLHTIVFGLDVGLLVVALLGTGVAYFVLSRWQTVRPFLAGDASLWHEFVDDSVPIVWVFIALYLVGVPLLYGAHVWVGTASTTTTHGGARGRVRRGSLRKRAMRLAFGVLPATIVAVLLTELGKGYVGRLRPYFARVCLSDMVDVAGVRQVISSNSECTSDLADSELNDGRRSFPSGHAALAMSGGAYVQLALLSLARDARLVDDLRAFLLVVLAWLWMGAGAWVSASRVYDNAHHVGDVAVGMVLGMWSAAVHLWFVLGRNQVDLTDIPDIAVASGAAGRDAAAKLAAAD